jgi:deazaflavin-dependent oxidoreductase (nitroreductase family)
MASPSGGGVPVLQLIGVVLGTLILALAVIGVVFVAGMRRKSPAVLRTVRRFNRAIVNPRALKTAGTPGAYASVIHHVGRTTGRAYRTPVAAEPTGDGFVIALPYGTTANWVKNVLASGSATIVDEGASYRVDHPEIVPLAGVLDHFPVKDRKGLARFRVDQCVRVRRVDPLEPSAQPTEPSAPPR